MHSVWEFDSKAIHKPGQAREQFVTILRAFGDAESDFEAAELIFAELVGNAIRHAPGPVCVRLEWEAPYAELTVHDEHQPFTPTFRLPDDPLQDHGRGLFIVATLARSVDVCDIAGDGTKVVAELPVKRSDRAA